MNLTSFIKICKLSLKRKAIIIFSPYFDESKMRDGFFRRVKVSDDLLSSVQRIYFDFESGGKTTEVTYPKTGTAVVKFSGGRIGKIVSIIPIIICRRVYCESVWQVRKKILYIPFVKVFVDVHGSVPEEEFLYGRYDAAQKYGDIEEAVVRRAEHLFCVTEAMIDHLREKYEDHFKANASVLPIFDNDLVGDEIKNYDKMLIDGKPLVTYAGGIFKWQKIEEMQFAIKKQIDSAVFEIYTPTPQAFWDTWGEKDKNKIKVESKKPEELTGDIYPRCHYGFVLRDNIVVNKVACPTKIPEYLKFGIIPIVDTPNIGDFKKLGMRYLTIEAFLKGELFSETKREELVNENYKCVDRYIDLYNKGVGEFKKVMLGGL